MQTGLLRGFAANSEGATIRLRKVEVESNLNSALSGRIDVVEGLSWREESHSFEGLELFNGRDVVADGFRLLLDVVKLASDFSSRNSGPVSQAAVHV